MGTGARSRRARASLQTWAELWSATAMATGPRARGSRRATATAARGRRPRTPPCGATRLQPAMTRSCRAAATAVRTRSGGTRSSSSDRCARYHGSAAIWGHALARGWCSYARSVPIGRAHATTASWTSTATRRKRRPTDHSIRVAATPARHRSSACRRRRATSPIITTIIVLVPSDPRSGST